VLRLDPALSTAKPCLGAAGFEFLQDIFHGGPLSSRAIAGHVLARSISSRQRATNPIPANLQTSANKFPNIRKFANS
jgi:hypothetical protein